MSLRVEAGENALTARNKDNILPRFQPRIGGQARPVFPPQNAWPEARQVPQVLLCILDGLRLHFGRPASRRVDDADNLRSRSGTCPRTTYGQIKASRQSRPPL